ncbi:MAG: metallophosphoesterase [bacterium]
MARKTFNAAFAIFILAAAVSATAQQAALTEDKKADLSKIHFAIVADNHFALPDSNISDWRSDIFLATINSLKFMQDTLKPDFVVYLGDAISGEGTQPITEQQSFDLTQAFIKDVGDNLTIPHYNVWGNHDGPNFPKIYGYKNKSFRFGDYFFFLMGIELTNYWSGVGKFTDWKYFENSLKENSGAASFVFIHEPIFPPTFENALKVKQVISKYPQIKFIFQGHTHTEQIDRAKSAVYITCAAFHKPPFYPLYDVSLSDGMMLITRYELKDGKYSGTEIFSEKISR